MKIENMLSKAKENSESNETPVGERTLFSSSDAADVFQTPGEELLLYESKSQNSNKLAAVLEDADVKLVQVSSGKPIVIVHAKHGAMNGNFSLSANNANKLLKNSEAELNVKTTTVKGDGGLLLSIEKINENTSVVDFINNGVLTAEAAAFLWTAIQGKVKRCNLLIVGSGVDRLEVLNALSVFIPSNERVAALNTMLHAEHWNSIDLPFEKAIPVATEMKYDWLIGEMQAKNGKNLHAFRGKLRAMLSMPANTCSEAMHVLRETSGKAANAIDLVISVHDFNNKTQITEISEVVNGHVIPFYVFEKGKLERVKLESELVKQAVYRGFSLKSVEAELESKQHEIENWNASGTRSNKEIRMKIKGLNY
ncbi:MAG: hypothetical protein V1644_01830 [Candidatus Micrarchaeota archaeon]